jgi:hypothetical protein
LRLLERFRGQYALISSNHIAPNGVRRPASAFTQSDSVAAFVQMMTRASSSALRIWMSLLRSWQARFLLDEIVAGREVALPPR